MTIHGSWCYGLSFIYDMIKLFIHRKKKVLNQAQYWACFKVKQKEDHFI